MGGQALPGKRRQAFLLDPDILTLITDRAHPLYDPRVNLPPDEKIVRNMMSFGVKVAIKVRKNGDSIEVVDGRRRVINCREANRRLEEMGGERLMVPCEVERGSDDRIIDMMVFLNELRRGDTLMEKAEKMQRYLDTGRTVDEAAAAWGLSSIQVKRYLALLDLSPPVRRAVERGQMTMAAAKPYTTMSREDQEAKLAEEDLPAPTPSGKPRRRRKSSVRPSKAKVRKVAERASPTIREALLWAVGDVKADDVNGERLRAAIFNGGA